MHGLETLKKLNEAVASNRASLAIRRGSKPRSKCCTAKMVQEGKTKRCGNCGKSGDPR